MFGNISINRFVTKNLAHKKIKQDTTIQQAAPAASHIRFLATIECLTVITLATQYA